MDKEEIFPDPNGLYPTKEKTKRRRIHEQTRERERERKKDDPFLFALVFGDAFAFCGSFLLSWLLSA